jgi:hypothetical protein
MRVACAFLEHFLCAALIMDMHVGVACLVVPPVEGDRGGSNKTADAL